MIEFLLMYRMEFCEAHPRLMIACAVAAGALALAVVKP